MVFIKGENVFLRGLVPQDLEGDYVSWLNDQEVCQYNNHYRFPYNASQAENYIHRVNEGRSQLVLAVCDVQSGKHIGNIALQNIDWINRNAEYAIIFGDTNFHGKGYAKEASNLILAHGFDELNLMRIYCGTSAENTSMQKLALAMGMVEEGRRRKAIYKHGQYIDVIEYGIVRSDCG